MAFRHRVLTGATALVLVGGGLVIGAPAAQAVTANTYYVGTTSDSTASVTDCATATNTDCTLRDAIDQANGDGSGTSDTILFTSLPAPSTFTLDPSNGELEATDGGSLLISGRGPDNTIVDGASGTEVFYTDGSDTTISGLTIQNGSTGYGAGLYNDGATTLSDVVLANNNASEYGGGIYNDDGTLTANNVFLSGNTAYYDGGAIYNNSTLNMTGGQMSDNSTTDNAGGGLYNNDVATLNMVTMALNAAFDDYGGGIYNDGTLTLTNSSVNGNLAGSDAGGGIYNASTATLSNDTFSGNAASDDGGAVYNDSTMTMTNDTVAKNSAYYGGGIDNESTLTLTNDTIAGNTANDYGGGIYNDSSLTIQGSILDGNTIANNVPNQCFGFEPITSAGSNVVGSQIPSVDCQFTGPGDKVNTSAALECPGQQRRAHPDHGHRPGQPGPEGGAGRQLPGDRRAWGVAPQPSSALNCDAGAFQSSALMPTAAPSPNSSTTGSAGAPGTITT